MDENGQATEVVVSAAGRYQTKTDSVAEQNKRKMRFRHSADEMRVTVRRATFKR